MDKPGPDHRNHLRPPPRPGESVRWKGMRVGLFGGSFNPPHEGHVHACLVAMKYLRLDAVWWMVSPGNPLKSKDGLPPVEHRMAMCREMITHPDIFVTDIERELGTVRTFHTVCALRDRFPFTDFIWLAGTDIAYEFDRWYRWRELLEQLPFAFIGRPTRAGLVRHNVFRQMSGLHHHTLHHGIRAPLEPGHVYWLFGEPLNPLSSTMLRQQNANLQGTT